MFNKFARNVKTCNGFIFSLNTDFLKKNFTIIFILISVSLIGIIYIQWNWISTMVENKEEELNHKLNDVTTDVFRELIEYKQTALSGSQLLQSKIRRINLGLS